MNNNNQLKPGRLSFTCTSALNIRGRIGNNSTSNESLHHLVFRLGGIEQFSQVGSQSGHDILFNNEVISFDLPQPNPNDLELLIELRENATSVVGRATYSIANVVLTSSEEVDVTLPILKDGDVTTNSVVNLKTSFTQAKQGVIKLSPQIYNGSSKNQYAIISTADGQESKKALLTDDKSDNAVAFYVDKSNWFSDFTIKLYSGVECIGSGKLSMLSCLGGSEAENETSTISISTDNHLSVNHWFLEAGLVRVESIKATNLSQVHTNPRIIFNTAGKTRTTTKMTNAGLANGSAYCWNDDICLSVVDEYTLTVECCEYDEVSRDHEIIGMADVSLLPLFKTGRIKTDLNLTLVTELGETVDGGQLHLSLSFNAPDGHAYPKDQATMSSYVTQQNDTSTVLEQHTKKNMSMDVDEYETFSEEAIQKAFQTFDLDKNGYVKHLEYDIYFYF